MAKLDLNLNISGGDNLGKVNRELEALREELEASEAKSKTLNKELEKMKAAGTKSAFDDMAKSVKALADSETKLIDVFNKNSKASTESTKTILDNFSKQIAKIKQYADVAAAVTAEQIKAQKRATSALTNNEKKLSENQISKIEKLLVKWQKGDINQFDFADKVSKISKVYSEAYKRAEELSSMTAKQLDHEEKMAEIARKKNYAVVDNAKAETLRAESSSKIAIAEEKASKTLKEQLETQKKINSEKIKQEENKTFNQGEQNLSKTIAARAKAEKEVFATRLYMQTAQEKADAQELRRQMKLEANDRARIAVQTKLREIIDGNGSKDSLVDRRAELSVKRLKETMQRLQEFAATKGFNGTSGLESTSYLRAQQYAKNIMEAASNWKQVNSNEGKAAATLERINYDVDKFRSVISMVHTSLGQVASALGAIRGIGQTIRKGLQQVVQYITQAVSQLTSNALTSSLEALKELELSEIGFGNFFGEETVSGIISQVKQEALTSPLSATQLASYVNQLAPLSKGNSSLAIDAAMGVAKMIQYSGGNVSSEMEYVVKNLRDVMSKGTATKVDIRQFNRAMPALEAVLKDMGLTEFLDKSKSTLNITAKNASKMLEAFQKINSSEDVGTIFEKTSETLAGLMERLEEQIQLLVIDVGDFSGLTDLIKKTLLDTLEDTDGWIQDIKMTLQFTFYDVTRWLKSRDWERILNTAKELFNILKTGIAEAFEGLKRALGGKDIASTLKALTEALTSFIKGIVNSYSWLIKAIKGLSDSGVLGSGVVQGFLGIAGFMSGGSGALITGLARGAGNVMGVFNQLTLAIQNFMKTAQVNLANAAAEVATFGEALAIVTGIMPTLAEDIALINQMYAGNMTAEEAASKAKILAQKNEVAASELVTRAKQAEAEASSVAAAADKAEAAASTTSGSTGIFGSLFGGSGKGTKLGSTFGKVLGAVVGGSLVGSLLSAISGGIASAAGADDLTTKNISAGFGNISSGLTTGSLSGAAIGSMISPGLGTAIGAAAGGLAGLISGIAGTVSQIEANQQEQIAEELAAFEAEVNSGDYTRQKIEEYGNGTLRLTTSEFDKVNSLYVKKMNQFNEAFPNGTAEMLKEYLKSIEGEVSGTNGILAVAGKEREQQANELWTLVDAGEIERANNYAQGLYDSGLTTAEVTSMLLQKANEAWAEDVDRADKLRNLILEWGDVQSESGEDLTLQYLREMQNGSAVDQAVVGDYRNQLKSLYLDMGQDLVANTELSTEEKKEISTAFADGMTKWMMGELEDMSAEEKGALTRLFTMSQIWDGGDAFGITMTPSELTDLTKFGTISQIIKWGINQNWSSWSSNATDPENNYEMNDAGRALAKAQENGEISIEEYWATIDENWKKYAKTSQEKLLEYAEDYYEEMGISEEQFNSDMETLKSSMNIDSETTSFVSQMAKLRVAIYKAAQTAKDATDTAKSNLEATNNLKNKLRESLNTDQFNTGTLKIENSLNKYNGGLIYRASGGDVRGVDTVPAMLQRGEYVVRKSAVEKFGLTALNALNTGNTGYFAKAIGRQNVYGDYSNARTWNSTSNDNRKSVNNIIKVYNNSKGARLNRYYSLANRLA